MKPKFIFSAVAAMCFLMIATLPRLAHIPSTGSASAAQISAPAAAVQEMLARPAQPQVANIQVTPTALATLPPIQAAAVPPAAADEKPPSAQTQAPIIEGQPVADVVDPFINAGTAIANGAAAAAADPSTLLSAPPELQSFTASVVNGQADMVVGLYVPDVLALPVLQQQNGDSNYISDQDGTVTQFSKPAAYGVTALLAHNFLSGRLFFRIGQGQELYVIYGDGDLQRYRINSLQSYQALSPYDPQSQFVDLNVADAPVISHGELFQRVYTTANQVVLQTCIEANGEPSWGRLFIFADPI